MFMFDRFWLPIGPIIIPVEDHRVFFDFGKTQLDWTKQVRKPVEESKPSHKQDGGNPTDVIG